MRGQGGAQTGGGEGIGRNAGRSGSDGVGGVQAGVR